MSLFIEQSLYGLQNYKFKSSHMKKLLLIRLCFNYFKDRLARFYGTVVAINIKKQSCIFFIKIIGFVKNSDAFIFDEPQLIADSIDDFFNNLVAFPKIEEEQQTEIIEIEGCNA